MSDWIEKAADRIARWLRPLMPVEATKAKVREVVHDAYMDRDGELRDLLCCPPDCDLTSWAKRMGNFWHDLEGGQVVVRYKACLKAFGVEDLREITPEEAAAMYEQWQADWDQAAKDSAEVESLKQQLADLERQYDRFEQIIQDADSQAYKLRELLDGKSPGRTVFAEMLVCLPEMVTQVQEMKEQLAASNARCAAMQKWVMFATREDAGQVMAAIDADVEQIAKDHRAMEAMRAKKYVPIPLTTRGVSDGHVEPD